MMLNVAIEPMINEGTEVFVVGDDDWVYARRMEKHLDGRIQVLVTEDGSGCFPGSLQST